ncbi:hypothetical protein [Methylobacterium sp. 174MFSha1.1]|nr:hypothetical protein [Methylobacterium sp. 174MFSha1.1]
MAEGLLGFLDDVDAGTSQARNTIKDLERCLIGTSEYMAVA